MIAAEQHWEYCQLVLSGEGKEGGKWFCDLILVDAKGHSHVLLEKEGKNSEGWPHNPWAKTFEVLGKREWELVTVQHGTAIGSSDEPLLYNYAIAYFKRPVGTERHVEKVGA